MEPITGEQKLLAIIAHAGYLAGGLGLIIAPLVIWLLKGNDEFVAGHARQALIAHLAVVAISAVVGALCFVLVGVLLIPALIAIWLLLFITSVIAVIKVLDGKPYAYPFIQGLIRKL